MRRLTLGLVTAIAIVVAACTVGPGHPAGSGMTVRGIATAGPVCPVERPGDSACAARPVPAATIVVTTPAGAEVARVTTAADGTFSVALAPGDYVLVPQPVAGLMGTAPSVPITVAAAGSPTPSPFPLLYDTGIR
jgi:hypothetical protein